MTNFIKDHRFEKFLDSLCFVSKTQKNPSYVDTSPNNIFDGEFGTILTKNGKDILYKKCTDADFVNLSNLFPDLINTREYALENGINKSCTWIKNTPNSSKQWTFLGYINPYLISIGCDACPVLTESTGSSEDTGSVIVYYNNYYGRSTSANLTDSEILALNYTSAETVSGSYAITSGSGYVYFACPEAETPPVSIMVGFFDVVLAGTPQSYSGSSGGLNYQHVTVAASSSLYKVYRSYYELHGDFNLDIT